MTTMVDTQSPAASPAAQAGESAPLAPKLEGPDRLRAIQGKVEYYLSMENLQKDRYLVSKMNADMWVEISLLCQFRGLQTLGADEALVVEALANSKTVAISDDKQSVRPNAKVERKTIIIRDLPADADEAEVLGIFGELTGEAAPTEARSEFGGNWFVTFSSETNCVNAHNSLSNKKFRDQEIHARIKSETLLKSLYQPPPQAYPMFMPGPEWGGGGGYEYYDHNGTPYYVPDMYMGQGYGRGRGFGGRQNMQRGGLKKPNKKKRMPTQSQPLQLGLNHFPPLPTKNDVPVQEGEKTGYGGEPFTQYTNSELIKVFEDMGNFKKPDFLVPCEVLQEEVEAVAACKTPLSDKESSETFFVVDQERSRSVSMSPFVSPYFSSMPVPSWPADDMLGPPASPSHKGARAMNASKTMASKLDLPGPAIAPATIAEVVKASTPVKQIKPAAKSAQNKPMTAAEVVAAKPADAPAMLPTVTPPTPTPTPAVAAAAEPKPAPATATSSPKAAAAEAPKSTQEKKEERGSFRDVLLSRKAAP